MEHLQKYNEDIYETFPEDTILDEATEVDNIAEKESDFLEVGSNSPPTAKSSSSEELTTQRGTAGKKSYLDSIFGELPPKSLIKTNLLFAKPPRPVTLYKTSGRHHILSISRQIIVAAEKGDHDVKAGALKTPRESELAWRLPVHRWNAPSSCTSSRAALRK